MCISSLKIIPNAFSNFQGPLSPQSTLHCIPSSHPPLTAAIEVYQNAILSEGIAVMQQPYLVHSVAPTSDSQPVTSQSQQQYTVQTTIAPVFVQPLPSNFQSAELPQYAQSTPMLFHPIPADRSQLTPKESQESTQHATPILLRPITASEGGSSQLFMSPATSESEKKSPIQHVLVQKLSTSESPQYIYQPVMQQPIIPGIFSAFSYLEVVKSWKRLFHDLVISLL